MSKSFGNAININDSPKEIFGKVMSVPDSLIPRYFQYVSGMSAQTYQPIVEKLCPADPREAKAKLGEQIVGLYYGREKGAQAREEFDRIFRDKGLPDEIKTVM